jgi:hypothetical protein
MVGVFGGCWLARRLSLLFFRQRAEEGRLMLSTHLTSDDSQLSRSQLIKTSVAGRLLHAYYVVATNQQPANNNIKVPNIKGHYNFSETKYFLLGRLFCSSFSCTQITNMRISVFSIAAALLLVQAASAFAPPVVASTRTFALNAALELKPEPEGGEEVLAVKTMEGSRMKNMGVSQGVKSDMGTVYQFWVSVTAQGALVKELNTKVLKDASKKAEFPGFRKVGHNKF